MSDAVVSPSAAPVSAAERIASMDVLRGAALLGIALMNIIFSGLPLVADFNPKVAGGATGLNLAAYFLQFVLFDGKMRGIFSIMFGAGSWYLISRGVRRGAGLATAEAYYRRTLWLMLFGMIHAYLIWHGDILFPYALLGLVLFPLHRASPRALLITASLFIAGMMGWTIIRGFQTRETHRLAMEAEAATAAHKPLTGEQKAAQTSWQEMRKYINPTAEDLKKERDMYGGSWFHLVKKRASVVYEWHAAPFYVNGWDMFTMMLVGIAFAQMGVLAGEKPYRFYITMMTAGYLIGIPIGLVSTWLAWKQGFEPLQSVFTFTTYQPARIAVTMGHLSLLILMCKAQWLPALRRRLAAVGQTALSNYIAHSLIYGFVFYGYGLNLFGKLQRYQLYYVVLGMWVFSLAASPLWLAHFRFGPLEWCWRSLTYWRKQPMRLAPEPAAEAVPSGLAQQEG